MNRASFFVVVLVLSTTLASAAFAQTTSRESIDEEPSIAEGTPGRPTLKQRLPRDVTSAAIASTVNPTVFETADPRKDLLPGNQKPIRFTFEGLHAFSEVEMVRAFNERGIGLPKPLVPNSEVISKGVVAIREMLEARGHFFVTINARNDEERGTVVFQVDEGQRLPLAEVRFEGNRSFTSYELASRLDQCVAKYSTSVGYDSSISDYCVHKVADFLRSEGYLKANLGESKKVIEARGLVLTIPVNEGVRYRLGEIKIEGAEAVAIEKVRAMLSLRQGDIARGEEIAKWLFEDLKQTYGELGYIAYTAEPEPEFKEPVAGNDEGVVDFKVTIEKGRKFRLRAIKFQGTNLPEAELLGRLRIRAGDVFNQRLYEESIDELNKLGRFELIDKDRDADFRTDEEEAVLDIVIKVSTKDDRVLPTSRQP